MQWITADSFDLLQRPFRCSVDDCHASYRRKDHLTRHRLRHQGKLFKCPIENCNREFTIQGNMKRHVKELHHEGTTSTDSGDQKQYICQEIGCGKVFKYASKLRQHEDSHGLLLKFQINMKFCNIIFVIVNVWTVVWVEVGSLQALTNMFVSTVNLDSVEAFCSEPGCMKYFTNKQCLEAHIRSCHQYIPCEICGSMQLKKNIKRHVRTHEARDLSERIKCQFKGCLLSFSTVRSSYLWVPPPPPHFFFWPELIFLHYICYLFNIFPPLVYLFAELKPPAACESCALWNQDFCL